MGTLYMVSPRPNQITPPSITRCRHTCGWRTHPAQRQPPPTAAGEAATHASAQKGKHSVKRRDTQAEVTCVTRRRGADAQREARPDHPSERTKGGEGEGSQPCLAAPGHRTKGRQAEADPPETHHVVAPKWREGKAKKEKQKQKE